MYIKSGSFLHDVDNWAIINAISTMNAERDAFDALMDQINDTLGITTADNTGIAVDKKDVRALLETSIYLVGNGLASLYQSQGKQTLKEKYDFNKTEISKFRDSLLFTIGSDVFKVADPIKTTLGGFLVTAANVNDLGAQVADFLDFLPKPQLKIEDVKINNKALKVLEDKTDKVLSNMDTYMKPLAVVNPILHGRYLAARAIVDNAATHSGSPDEEGTVPTPGFLVVSLPAGLDIASASFRIEIAGGSHCFATFNSNPPAALPAGLNFQEIINGTPRILTSAELNYDAALRPALILFTDGDPSCTYKLWIE